MKLKPKSFEFISYQIESKKGLIRFRYKITFEKRAPLFFTENILLPAKPDLKKVPKNLLHNLLQGIHLMLGVSYYKLYCPPEIKLRKALTKEQADFWNSVYRKGLSEFFYRNKLNPQIVRFPYSLKGESPCYSELKKKNRVLVGIGGGKDSIVAAELLKEHKKDVSGFIVETQRRQEIIKTIADKLGIPTLKIRRLLDEKLIDGNLPGTYKGHIPVSGIYAFLGMLTAVLYDFSYVVVGNEHSSDFGNLKYRGEVINHQWSKSVEFEKLFGGYCKKFITPDITYFSLLRPFYEIRVTELFTKHKKYFSFFSSCNKSFKINRPNNKNVLWCGECPKCAFVFLMLAAFLSKKEIVKIFQKNLLDDEMLLSVYRNLLGFGEPKPFDCVGIPEETRAALYLAKNKFKDDVTLKTFLSRIKNPKTLIKKVFSTSPAETVPTKFKFLGMKNALILGYGQEGQTTKEYLRKKFPNMRIGIADRKQGPAYLEKEKDYDIVVKTPGIPKTFVKSHYTTATNIFFSEISNTTIGVTGSKGKSTTASLIYEILKTGGINVKLLGNIGNPMLGALMKPVPRGLLFVLELSSYQLDDIEFSPNIAIITNLFPEHMNYHKGIQNYYRAKKNILAFQRSTDVFIYNSRIKELIAWTKTVKSRPMPFSKKLPLKKSEIPLLGKHNLENIRAAITVAKIFNVSDPIIKKTVATFKGLPHRLECIGEFRGITFYDDAISTTPESTIAAIQALPNIGTILLGGEDRGYDFSKLEKEIKKHRIGNVVLFPKSGYRIFKSDKKLNTIKTSSMEEAVKFAYRYTPRGTLCLLSTASPSYSLWKNFEEKGDEFRYWVKKYAVG